ncbi:MAG: hypothetical protein ACE5HV_04750 [Acidobacteriota bacterium]
MESLATWFQENLLPFGSLGILLLAALDSSFVPMPQIIDLAIMAACALSPQQAWPFSIAAILGSTVGTMVIYSIARGGRMAFEINSSRLAWAEAFLQRRGTLAMLIAALLPAPFPFKIVVIAAGYLKQPIGYTVIGVVLGRSLRFGSEAALAAVYGRTIIAHIVDNAPLAGLVLALVFLIAGTAYHRFRKRHPTHHLRPRRPGNPANGPGD